MVSGCLEWLWHRNGDGYGMVRYEGKPGVLAHRAAYCLANGVTLDSIKGQEVRHKCDNPGCVEPTHLELGTHAENMTDMVARGRSAKGERAARFYLTHEQVASLRADRSTMTYKQLGEKYGISEAHCCRICLGKQR